MIPKALQSLPSSPSRSDQLAEYALVHRAPIDAQIDQDEEESLLLKEWTALVGAGRAGSSLYLAPFHRPALDREGGGDREGFDGRRVEKERLEGVVGVIQVEADGEVDE